MLDVEKNKTVNEIAGVAVMKAMAEHFHNEPIYFHAAFHQWQNERIEEGLKNGEKPKDIAREAHVTVRTVYAKLKIYQKKISA